jgi:mannose-6-phosphate isomerase-like protein (cupin superfamily)
VDTPQYKVDAGRRTGAGPAELHDAEVDVIRVVDGNAAVDVDGVRHDLAEGDVLVVPDGLTHQFVEATDPFLYYVVKVEV